MHYGTDKQRTETKENYLLNKELKQIKGKLCLT